MVLLSLHWTVIRNYDEYIDNINDGSIIWMEGSSGKVVTLDESTQALKLVTQFLQIRVLVYKEYKCKKHRARIPSFSIVNLKIV